MSYHGVLILIVVVGINLLTYVSLKELRDMVRNRLLNDTRTNLTNVLYEELIDLGYETVAEQSVKQYFQNKLDTVYSRYKYIRDNGIERLRNEAFEKDLLGSAKIELEKDYAFFPAEFVNHVDKINRNCFNNFKSNLMFDIKTDRHTEFILSLKNNTIISFRQNVRQIYKLFNDTRHLIIDPDYRRKHPETEKLVYTEETTGKLLSFRDTVSLDIKMLKVLISSGMEGLEDAIRLLMIFTKDNQARNNEVILFSNRMQRLKNDAMLDTREVETEFTKLTQALLDFIDTLK